MNGYERGSWAGDNPLTYEIILLLNIQKATTVWTTISAYSVCSEALLWVDTRACFGVKFDSLKRCPTKCKMCIFG